MKFNSEQELLTAFTLFCVERLELDIRCITFRNMLDTLDGLAKALSGIGGYARATSLTEDGYAVNIEVAIALMGGTCSKAFVAAHELAHVQQMQRKLLKYSPRGDKVYYKGCLINNLEYNQCEKDADKIATALFEEFGHIHGLYDEQDQAA